MGGAPVAGNGSRLAWVVGVLIVAMGGWVVGYRMGVEAGRQGAEAVTQDVKPSRPAPVVPMPAPPVAERPVVSAPPPQPPAQAAEALPPTLTPRVDSDLVVANSEVWAESEVVAYDGDTIEFGPFGDRADLERLHVRSGGADVVDPRPIELWDGRFVARVTFGGPNVMHAPIRVRITEGEPLAVDVRRLPRWQ